jgi:hypothetical protein
MEIILALSAQEVAKLRRIVSLAETMMAKGGSRKRDGVAGKQSKKSKRIRRSGRELIQFRKMLKSERQKGVPVSELARKHGISSAYIYTLP